MTTTKKYMSTYRGSGMKHNGPEMKDSDVSLHSEIVAAVKRSIQIIGKDAFKRTSLFGSSEAQYVSGRVLQRRSND
jgi:hypothetical protein